MNGIFYIFYWLVDKVVDGNIDQIVNGGLCVIMDFFKYYRLVWLNVQL